MGSFRGPDATRPVAPVVPQHDPALTSGEQPCSDDAARRQLFEAEIERLMDRLYGTALRLTRDRTDAEDLVAEALAKAWAHLASLQDLQCFEKWVFRILVNTFIGDRRRQAKTPCDLSPGWEDDGFSLFERLHQPFLLWWGNPEQQLLDKLRREDIERALDALPEVFRIVVVMVEAQGFSYAEVAETLNVPVGTVRSRLSRGRSLLQASLWRQARQLGIAVGGSGGDAP
jgi:RNA polymerase sigma-70 factor, ECF subfamily